MGISIDATVSNKLGLASHQNAVPLLRRIALTNEGDEPVEDLMLEFGPSLPFATSKIWRIDRLSAGSTLEIPDRDVELKEAYLTDLSESVRTSADLRLRFGGSIIAE